MSNKAMYMQKTLSSTVHYLQNPQRPMAYGNFTSLCGTVGGSMTAIQYVPHGVKVCKRCVKTSIREKLKS
jgi:hypothetical protein